MTYVAAVGSALLSVVAPIFGLILLGRGLVRLGPVDAAGTKGLTGVIFWALLPSLLFTSLLDARSPPSPATILGYFGVALPLFAAAVSLGVRHLDMTSAQASVFALNATYGNTVLLGIPIVNAVWGSSGLAVLMSIIAAHSLLLLPIATVLIELGQPGVRPSLAGAIVRPILTSLRNPVVSSILAATVWRLCGWPVPEAFRRSLDLLAQAAPAMALIGLGASLPPARRGSVEPSVRWAVGIKLIIMPILMGIVVSAAALPAPAPAVMILTAALPTGANAFLLARRSESMLGISATTVVVATTVALVTLTMLLSVLPK